MNLKDKNVLIAFFSEEFTENELKENIDLKVGNTRLLEINFTNPFKKENVYEFEDFVNKRLIEFEDYVENIDDYDMVFLGHPNSKSRVFDSMFKFLSNLKLSNKRVIPFVTEKDSNLMDNLKSIEKICSEV